MQSFEVAWMAVIVCVVMGIMALAGDRKLIALLFLILAVVALNGYYALLPVR